MNAYNNLCVFNFGKHIYVVIKNADKVMYFESINGKYSMPIINFNLYDNQGKSLTLVNQHFFMNQLVSRLNVAFKKGYFSSDEDVVKYLNDLKNNSENNVELMKLFKGSLMSEINEVNFEHNKREILKFLDKYRFDTFVNYNNVAIFNGSIDKNSDSNVPTSSINVETPIQNFDFSGQGFPPMEDVVQVDNVEQQVVEPVIENVEQPVIEENIESIEQVVNNSNTINQVIDETPIMEQPAIEQPIVDEPIEVVDDVESKNIEVAPVENVEQPIVENVQQSVVDKAQIQNDSIVGNNSNDDMFNFNTVVNESSNFVDSSDYFSSLGGVSQETVLQGPVVAGVSSNDYFSQFNNTQSQTSFNDLGTANTVLNDNNQQGNLSYVDEVRNRLNSSNLNQSVLGDNFQELSEPVVEQSSISPIVQPIVEQQSSVEEIPPVESFVQQPQTMEQPVVQTVVDNSVSVGTSIPDAEIENAYSTEIEQVNETFGFGNSNSTVGETVIDNSKKNELEQISSSPLEDVEDEESDKKGKVGIIIFMILLVLALGFLAFYLYNYVF